MTPASPTDGPARRPAGALPALSCILALLTTGCPLFRPRPAPPPLPPGEVVRAVRALSEGFHTVTDGDISLSIRTVDEAGRARRLPTLGGALAFDALLPALWLLTEKLTRTVFLLKAAGPRFWLVCYSTNELVTGTEIAYRKLPQLLRPDEVRSYFAGPEQLGISWPTAEMVLEPADYRFDVRVLGVLRRQVFVDRRRLVLSGIRRYDALGRVETDLRMDRYRPAGDGLFPRRLWLDRPLNGVTIELHLGDPKPNKPLPEATFAPPPLLPGWRLIDLDVEDPSAIEFFRAD